MSYILDALRKSEQARQKAAGQGGSLLYPIEIRQERSSWLTPMLLVLAASAIFGLMWWIWMGLKTTQQSEVKAISAETVSRPSPSIPEKAATARSTLLKNQNSDMVQTPALHPLISTSRVEQTSGITAHSRTAPALPQSAKADPLQDLPPLNIAGYIHNEQSGSLAMINNRLVHEGDEISPGLRLEKIRDDSAIFSYKGYVFSR
jgi:general secretion pathway protein B